jgi:hypothetical protein
MFLRRFDTFGKPLSSVTINARGRSADEETFLRSSHDRVAWFTRFDQYFEFSLDGKQIGPYEGPSRNVTEFDRNLTGFALSGENDAVVSRLGKTTADF